MKLDETLLAAASARDHRFWLRIGSIAAILLGLGYIVIIPLYARVGAPPNGGEAWFQYLPGKVSIWWAIIAISVFTDLLYIPIALALYLTLEKLGRNAMLMAVAFMGLFVVLDLAITWPHFTSIVVLYGKYLAATSDIQRQGFLAAANYGSAVLNSPLEAVYAIVTLSIGIMLAGLVMLRGVFDKLSAWLAIAVGVSGIAAPTGLSVAVYGNALLATIWLFLVGYRLYRLAQA
jgi:hypothetical protein